MTTWTLPCVINELLKKREPRFERLFHSQRACNAAESSGRFFWWISARKIWAKGRGLRSLLKHGPLFVDVAEQNNEMMFQLVELRTVHVIIQPPSEWPLKCAWNVTNAGGFSTQVRHRPEVVSSKCLPIVLCGRRWPVSSLSSCSVSLHILHIISYGGGRAEPTMSTGHISAIRGLISRLSGRAGWMMNIIWQIFPIFTFCWVKFWVTKNEVGSRERGGYLRVEDGWFVTGREGWRRWRENVEWYDDG